MTGYRSRVLGVLAAAALLTLSGCAADRSEGDGPAQRSAGPADEAGDAAPQPVIDQDFPDPDVLLVAGTYYAYATQRSDNSRNVQVATSTDLTAWRVMPNDVLPALPSWATSGRTWAPDVSAVGSGFVMYLTAWDADSGLQCIGVATSDTPLGPFEPATDKPLVCPERQGGAIDASSFEENDGSRWLLWKNDGNCCGKPTWIHLQRLSRDGLRIAGPATRLIREDQAWEGDLVEAPTLVRHDDEYVLFYSANSYGGEDYATGYAVADRLQGPYRKADDAFLTTDGTGVTGPGGQDVVVTPTGKSFVVVHGWDPAVVYRGMYVLPLTWRGGRPVVSAAAG